VTTLRDTYICMPKLRKSKNLCSNIRSLWPNTQATEYKLQWKPSRLQHSICHADYGGQSVDSSTAQMLPTVEFDVMTTTLLKCTLPCTHWLWGWVGTRASLNGFNKSIISRQCRNVTSIPWLPACRPVTTPIALYRPHKIRDNIMFYKCKIFFCFGPATCHGLTLSVRRDS
jgi:hypothetical protein